MKILVACEYSGVVREAFRTRGHYAVSCDTLPTDLPGPHYQGDVLDILYDPWDMIIAFPPCTKLSSVGAAYWAKWQADGSQEEALQFVNLFANHPAQRIAIENPAGKLSSAWRKPDQYIQPWWFGHPWTKRTGLWLKGLPQLVPTNPIEPLGFWVDGGKRRKSGKHEGVYEGAALKSNGGRAHSRSRTFTGLAEAMAEQWGTI